MTETQWRARDTVLTSELDDEVALLDKSSGTYIGLDAVGTTLWRLLALPQKLSDLVAGVVAEYEVEPAQAEADITSFLQKLQRQGLIETVPQG